MSVIGPRTSAQHPEAPLVPTRLYHFSEDPAIERFVPRIAPSSSLRDEVVWAVDAEHADLYYFPRDCPRVSFCATAGTSTADRERFLAFTTGRRVSAIEAGWLPAMRSTAVYRYEFDAAAFQLLDANAGYWTSRDVAVPVAVEPVGDLLTALMAAGVEVRILPSLWPLYEAVIASSLAFSIIRWRNAAPREAEHDANIPKLPRP